MRFAILTLGLAVLVLFLLAGISSKLLGRKLGVTGAYAPFAAVALLCIGFMSTQGENWRYPVSYWIHGGRPEAVTVGQVEAVLSGTEWPKYYDTESRSFYSGKYLVIDGEAYYDAGGNIAVGQWVRVEYIAQDRVVCNRTLLTEAQGHNSEETAEVLPVENTSDGEKDSLGYPVYYISFAVLLLVALIRILYRNRLERWMNGRETKTRAIIGVLIVLAELLPAYGIVMGWRLLGLSTEYYFIVLTVLTVLFIWQTVKKEK